ncbi:hypothetical protein [Paenibacillus sp. SI8]|uniref:hypothetical protein n=1 Tax=unclassified Paenibacillus TaxID=185978 RepID=UPI0034658D89
MMIFTFYILLNSAVVLFLWKYKKKNIHILEVLVYWLFAGILYQNYSALLYMNFKLIIIPDTLSLEMAHFINRTVLYPVFTILFLNHFIRLQSAGKKIALILSYVVLFNGLEGLADWLGVLMHTKWKLWWSFSFWIIYLLLSIGFMKFFRMKLKEELQPA